MNKFYIFTVLILASLSLLAQQATLQTFDEVAPHDLAALIMGEQAVVSNARVEGDDGAGGLFMGATDLGFENGVILTTGSAEVALSHNHIGSSTLNTGTAGDPDLENFPWSYSGTYNACILEFDFVPTGNQISFDYIFGSDEYPEWVGSQFNDAFAIFIEGGSEYPSDTPIEERNIAIIPGTSDVYVAINFLNAGSYNEFYIDNTTAEREIQYDGFTLPLPATASVTPGLTYHLKFSIADVSDASYDSGIFIALEGEDVLVYKTLNLLAFWDQNGNNSQDENETALYNQSFLAEPSNKLITTNSEGESSVALLEGNHQLSFKETTLWEMVVPTTYDISIDENTELPTYFFGLQPKRIIYDVVPHLNSSPTRCNTEVTYYLDYNNSGTTIGNGKVSLEFDELMEFVEAVPQPDGIQDGKLIWNFANLYPSHQNKIQIRFNIPDENFIGEILETQATVETYFEDQVIAKTESTSYYSEVRCSYDPNDKLVRSNLLGQSEFAYLADTVFYTVRFQNTGNDVAFNVRVEDVLDKKLDWTTFHPITASHDFYTTFDRTTGKATFFFDNIMLPDNKTNEAESHGFVMFGIVSLSNIGDKLEVDNTASIFFDENPPIVTNTAILTLVEQVETDIEVININYSIRIFPNPFSDYTTIEVGGLPQGSYRLEVIDILGRKVQELKIGNRELQLDRGDLESGLYLIQVLEEESSEILGSGKVLVE